MQSIIIQPVVPCTGMLEAHLHSLDVRMKNNMGIKSGFAIHTVNYDSTGSSIRDAKLA